MISLGLSPARQRLFEQALVSAHEIKFRVRVLDLNHRLIDDVTDQFLDGQVNVDGSRTPHRDLTLSLASKGLMAFESGNFSTGTNYSTRMMEVLYGVENRALGDAVWVPVFVGPITSFSREDATVNITAVSKEQLMMTKQWKARTYPKGTGKIAMITDLLRRNGETRIDMPPWPAKSDKPMTITAEAVVWDYLFMLGHSWGSGLLTYDSRGYAKLFATSLQNRWTFRGGEGGSLLSQPKMSYSMGEEFTNAARVYGKVTTTGTKPAYGEYVAPASHPLSPAAMSRGGVPQYWGTIMRDAEVANNRDATNLAKSLVEQGMIQSTTAEFDALPIPHLESWDMVTVSGDHFSSPFRLKKFSLPLNSSNPMTVGYTARVSKWRK